MPDLVLKVAADTTLQEPMWCYIEIGGRAPAAPRESRLPTGHAAGLDMLTGVRLVSPPLHAAAVTAQMAQRKVIAWEAGEEHLLHLEFDAGRQGRNVDFRPDLPVVFRW